MSDELIAPDGRHVVKSDEHVMDVSNRPWAFHFCTSVGLHNPRVSEVYVRQVLHDGKLAKTVKSFRLDFFPGYKIKPEFVPVDSPVRHRMEEGFVIS